MAARSFQIYALAVMLAGVAVLVGLAGGQLGLAPSAALALAVEILRGGALPVAPPGLLLSALLLVPLLVLGLADWSPLLLSVLGQGAAVWLLAGALSPAVGGRPASALVAGPLLVLAVNGVALPLTGVAGPLSVAASVAVLVGLAQAAKGRWPGFLLPAVLGAPLLGGAGMALALAASIALFSLGYRVRALAVLVTLGAVWVLTRQAAGLTILPPLPPATGWAAEGRRLLEIAALNAREGIRTATGGLLAVLAILLALLALTRPNRPRNAVVWPALAGIATQFLAGGGGEMVAVTLALAAYLLQLRRPAAAPLALLALFAWSHGPPVPHPPPPPPPEAASLPTGPPAAEGSL